MDFDLSDEQKMLKRTVRDFAEKEIKPTRAEFDEKAEYPIEILRRLGDMGIMGMAIPPEYGGSGADAISYAIAVEELSKIDPSVAVAVSVHNSLGCDPIVKFGTEEQKKKWLPGLASGKKIGCFCLTEPDAGSDAAAVKGTARLDGDEYIINARKQFITNAAGADLSLVFVMTDREKGYKGISGFLVPTDAPGFSRGKKEKKMGIHASVTMEMNYDDCRIPKENLLGEEGDGFKIALWALDAGRIGVAAQAVGIAQGALNEAIAYSKERIQFGKPISSFQAIQWMIADMATEIDAARFLVYRAAYVKDKGGRFSSEAAMAKLKASDVAVNVSRDAVQIFGGYGYMREYPVERYYRDAKITEIYEGTSEIQRMVISRALLR
ncbi:MAG: acyl-CoA dehydrogenase [Candidatus Thermoplasmatota archaeon]|nr:acyl-CoA dehydrogenase [Candidatus Thermoplasmatota archaeon]